MSDSSLDDRSGDAREDIGSNNWVVSGKLTASGYPMMMNDPHRDLGAPSLRYWVHLVAPGWNVIGGGEPALPGVSIGHNDFGAWGLTIFGTDSEDLYVYDTNPANPSQYKYSGAWEVDERHQGIDSGERRSAGSGRAEIHPARPGGLRGQDPSQSVRGARGVAGDRAARRTWRACAWINRIAGRNFWMRAATAAFRPKIWSGRTATAISVTRRWESRRKRPNWSGLVPVPGDGRYEWDGFLPIKALPHVLNPEKGFYNTSNDYQIPRGWPYKDALHYVWADPYRAQSVAEFLSSGRRFAVADMVQLQNNDLSIPARSLVPLLRDIEMPSSAAQQAASRLLHWNDVLDKDSVEAGIYEMWQRRLMANVRAVVVPKAAQAFSHRTVPPMSRIVSWMYAPDGRFGAGPDRGPECASRQEPGGSGRGTIQALRSGHGEMEARRISLRAHSQPDDRTR